MLSSFLKKLKYHKITVCILTIIYVCFGCIILFRLNFDELGQANIILYFVWFGMILLFLLIVSCFDGQSQPYLYAYHPTVLYIPWFYFIGYIGSLMILRLTGNKIISVIIFIALILIAIIVYLYFNVRLKNVTDEVLIENISRKLISLPDEELSILNRHRKFYGWNITVLLAVVLIAGKYLVQYKYIFLIFVFLIYIYCILSCLGIFKIRYKAKSKLILNLTLSSVIYICLTTFAVLLNFKLLPFFNKITDPLDIVMLVAFGLAPFAKQASFAYFAQAHNKIREEIALSNDL